MPAELNRASEPTLAFVCLALHVVSRTTERAVSARVAHCVLALVEVVEAGRVALVVCISEIEGALNLALLTLRSNRFTGFIVGEAVNRGNHAFR